MTDLGSRVINEVKIVLDDLYYLVTQRIRGIGQLQAKIMLKHAMERLVFAHNEMIQTLKFTSPDLVQLGAALREFIPTARKILNYTPPNYEEFWLQFYSLSTQWIRTFAESINFNDNVQIEATAHLLSQLLTGIDSIDELPPPLPFDDPEYINQQISILNALSSTGSLYSVAVQISPIIAFEEIVGWVNLVFSHYRLKLELLNNLSWETYFRVANSAEEVYQTILFSTWSFNDLVNVALKLQEFFGDDWPKEIVSANFFDDYNHNGICQLLDLLVQTIDSFLFKLDSAKKAGLIPINDDPNKSQKIASIKGIRTSFLTLKDIVKTTIISFEDNPSNIDETMNRINTTLKNLESLTKGQQFIYTLGAPQQLGYLRLLKFQILLATNQAIKKADSTPIEKLAEEKSEFLKLEHPISIQYEIMIMYALLHTYNSLKMLDNFSEIRNRIDKTLPRNQSKPRDYVSLQLLSLILEDGFHQQKFMYLKKYSEDMGIADISPHFVAYLQYLEATYNGKKSEPPPFQKPTNSIDPKSAFTPELNPMFYPFNRETDKIIR